jgi:hypothetical protein
MAFITADRVKDTSTTTGTGNITVSGSAPFGYRTFSTVLSVSDTFYYCIQGQSTSEWEVGLGTYVSSNQFARTTVLSSSASNSAVLFSSGTKNVFITLPANKTLQFDATGTPTAGGVLYGTGSMLAYSTVGTSGQFLQSNGSSAPTWTSTGTGTVTSVAVSGGTTGFTTSGGPVTTSGTITLAGTLAIANGGTNSTATPTAGTIPYGTGTALAYSSAGTSGQVLTSGGSGAPTWTTVTGTGSVTSVNVSGGSTGLTYSGGPITGSGTITMAGTLAVANGGTGVTTSTGSGNLVLSASPTLTGTVTATTITSPSATALTFQYGGTTGVTLDTSGILLVNQTASIPSENGKLQATGGTGTALALKGGSNNYFATFYNTSNTLIGSITGSTGSSTSYNTSSDYRLKENVSPLTSGLTTINALKPVTYNWINDKSQGEGFIAHELQTVIPHAVTGEKDAVNSDNTIKTQGVDYSKIVVHLVAAIQELSAKNDAFEARLAALEVK